MPGGGNGRSGTAVFREKKWLYVRTIGVCGYGCMDIHGKSVDMDMDVDGKFHIHGEPGNTISEITGMERKLGGNAKVGPRESSAIKAIDVL